MLVAVLLALWAAAISGYDGLRRRIPNVALLLVCVPAVLALVFQGQGLLGERPWSSAGGLVIGFGLTLPGYVLRALGAGDVKFAALLGLLLGASRGFELVLLASVLMGVMGLVLLFRLQVPREFRFPVAPMLAAAFVAEMVSGPLLPIWRR